MQRRRALCVFVVMVIGLLIGTHWCAAHTDPRVGAKFMPRAGCRPKIGNRDVSVDTLAVPLNVAAVHGDWMWVGDAWVRSADVVPLERAAAYYTDHLRSNSASVWGYRQRAFTYEAEGRFDDALLDYAEVIRLSPTDPQAYVDRALIRWERREYEKALADINEALRLRRDDAVLYIARALLSAEHKKAFDDAMSDIDEAIRLEPNLGIAYGARALIREKKHEFELALEDYAVAIRVDPEDYSSYLGMANLLSTAADRGLRDPKRAIEVATRACELTKWQDSAAIHALGVAYSSFGDMAAAKKWLSKAGQLGDAPEPSKAGYSIRLLRTGKLRN